MQVPLNETGFLLPWWQRTIIRSSVVAAITMVSILIVSSTLDSVLSGSHRQLLHGLIWRACL